MAAQTLAGVVAQVVVAQPAADPEDDASLPGPPGVLLTVAYHGGAFAGFAPQRGQRTVAASLLEAIQAMDPTVTAVTAVSRTDAGVHARGQRVAFKPGRDIPAKGWVFGLVQKLPHDISVVRASLVPRGFVPSLHCRWKRYRYALLVSELRDPHWEGQVWRIELPDGVDEQRIEKILAPIVGEHDFRAFRSVKDLRTETRRTIFEVKVRRHLSDARVLWVEIKGSAFMHNMVRILVGTAVDIARDRIDAGAFETGLLSGRRVDVGMTAPARGLYLDQATLDVEEINPYPAD